LAAREQRDKQIVQKFMADHPELWVSEETASLVAKYLLHSGVSFKSTDFLDRCEQIMGRISATSLDLSGEWLFKAVLTERGIAGAGDEKNFMGIASVKADSTTLAIVSVEGTGELSVSGDIDKGRFKGMVGIAGYSMDTTGAVVEDKISLPFQALTSNGTVQGNVVLQRIRPKVQTQATGQAL
jgi:hypothetical protein